MIATMSRSARAMLSTLLMVSIAVGTAAARRDKVTDPATVALVRASEPILAQQVYRTYGGGLEPVDGCRKARRGQPYRVDLQNRSAVLRGKKGSESRFEVHRTIYMEGANRSGFVTVSYDIPLVGIHETMRFFLPACVTTPRQVAVGYYQERSPGNTQAPLVIHESGVTP